MLFNSYTFALFFIAVLGVHNLPLSWRAKKRNLLIASYLFYAAWNPLFVLLLWTSTAVDWVVARRIHGESRCSRRRALLWLSLAVNLGLLGFFKYGDFLVEIAQGLLATVGLVYHPPKLDLVLPVGISFYTFQTLSYTLDVYFRKAKPWGSLLDYALYVTFFPQLVAGPIVRAGQFLSQCTQPHRASSEQVGWGLCLLTLGIAEKTLLADRTLAPVADALFGSTGTPDTLSAWVGALAFTGQIFFDFSGYSLCAIGAGLCLGFRIPDNFRFPYAAVGFSDFWRRWHISLSSWLRDYLYIPLGGNRRGEARRWINQMATMLIGGLWHGASWTFVAWGGLHGLYLFAERLLQRRLGGVRAFHTRPAQVCLGLLTFTLVCVAYVFFRAPDFGVAASVLSAMAGLSEGPSDFHLKTRTLAWTSSLIAAMLIAQWRLRESSLEELAGRWPRWVRYCLIAGTLLAIVLNPGEDRAFIYFQF